MKSVIILILLSITLCHNDISEILLQLPTIRQEIINTVNNDINSTWVAGENIKFKDIKLKEFQAYLGAFKTPRNVLESELPVLNYAINLKLPDSFDLRNSFPQCESLKEIRDQSTCGSCWALSAAEVMSDRICIKSKGKLQMRISAEDILSCCKSCGYGCKGGYPFAAFQFWQSSGVVTGNLYGDKKFCKPYSFPPCNHYVSGKYQQCGEFKSTPKCEKTCQNEYERSYSEDKITGSAYIVPNNEQNIMQEIYTNGSVEAVFMVYEDFTTYKSGVYKHITGKNLGGHAVKIIGWGIENGTKFWQAVNQWNGDWGDSGTFKILRGSDECGIESEIVAGIPHLGLDFLQ